MTNCNHGFPNAPGASFEFALMLFPCRVGIELEEGLNESCQRRRLPLWMGSHGMRTHLASLTDYPLIFVGLTACTSNILVVARWYIIFFCVVKPAAPAAKDGEKAYVAVLIGFSGHEKRFGVRFRHNVLAVTAAIPYNLIYLKQSPPGVGKSRCK